MKWPRKNMGTTDRGIRILLATGMGTYAVVSSDSILAGILLPASLLLMIVGLVGFCPLYVLFKPGKELFNFDFRKGDII